jgi:hypothetical protein
VEYFYARLISRYPFISDAVRRIASGHSRSGIVSKTDAALDETLEPPVSIARRLHRKNFRRARKIKVNSSTDATVNDTG